jgi:hypothetical protein
VLLGIKYSLDRHVLCQRYVFPIGMVTLSNDIPVPMDCEHACTIYNSLFQTNEQDKYTFELCTRSNQI